MCKDFQKIESNKRGCLVCLRMDAVQNCQHTHKTCVSAQIYCVQFAQRTRHIVKVIYLKNLKKYYRQMSKVEISCVLVLH